MIRQIPAYSKREQAAILLAKHTLAVARRIKEAELIKTARGVIYGLCPNASTVIDNELRKKEIARKMEQTFLFKMS